MFMSYDLFWKCEFPISFIFVISILRNCWAPVLISYDLLRMDSLPCSFPVVVSLLGNVFGPVLIF